jgi:Ni,Fe-hydrogenase I small subunit
MQLLLRSIIRSAHPLVKDAVLSMISLDYDDTLMAAAARFPEGNRQDPRQEPSSELVAGRQRALSDQCRWNRRRRRAHYGAAQLYH